MNSVIFMQFDRSQCDVALCERQSSKSSILIDVVSPEISEGRLDPLIDLLAELLAGERLQELEQSEEEEP